jgi:N-acetyl-beta-hexosaminidase
MRDFVLPYTSTKKTASDANVHMTAVTRFSLNEKSVNEVDASSRIIPTPFRSASTGIASSPQKVEIDGILMTNGHLLDKLQTGASDLLQKLGVSEDGHHLHTVEFLVGSLPSDIPGSESYSMEITKEGTTIIGVDAAGLFHGFMSFIGHLDVTNSGRMTLTEMLIYDKPRFEYRGHQVRSIYVIE